jgi:hypothetical protein
LEGSFIGNDNLLAVAAGACFRPNWLFKKSGIGVGRKCDGVCFLEVGICIELNFARLFSVWQKVITASASKGSLF